MSLRARAVHRIALAALAASLLTSGNAEAREPDERTGLGVTVRTHGAYPLLAGMSLGLEGYVSSRVALEGSLGLQGGLEKRRDEGGGELLFGARYLLVRDGFVRPYLFGAGHLRWVSGSFGGDVVVIRAFGGGVGGAGAELPIQKNVWLRVELAGSATPRLAIMESDQGDGFRAQLRAGLGLTGTF